MASSNIEKLKTGGEKKAVNAFKTEQKQESSMISKTKDFVMSKIPTRKTMIDSFLFATAVYVIVRHGKDIAGTMDSFVPTE